LQRMRGKPDGRGDMRWSLRDVRRTVSRTMTASRRSRQAPGWKRLGCLRSAVGDTMGIVLARMPAPWRDFGDGFPAGADSNRQLETPKGFQPARALVTPRLRNSPSIAARCSRMSSCVNGRRCPSATPSSPRQHDILVYVRHYVKIPIKCDLNTGMPKIFETIAAG
jgi:hypothetical protein